MSTAAVLRTPTHEPAGPYFGAVAHPNSTMDANRSSLSRSAIDSATNPPVATRPPFSTEGSSYSVISAPRTVANFSNTPPLGSSYSATEPKFPGAWVGTAPGTPAPIKDDVNYLAQQLKEVDLTGRAKQVLPAAVAQYIPEKSQDAAGVSLPQPGSPDPLPAPAARRVSVPFVPDEKQDSLTETPNIPLFSGDDHRENRPRTPEHLMGSTISPDLEVQEAAKNASPEEKKTFIVPINMIPEDGHTPTGQHEPVPELQASVRAPHFMEFPEQHAQFPSNAQLPNRPSETAEIQQQPKKLAVALPIIATGERDSEASAAQAVSSTASKKADFRGAPSETRSNLGAGPHSAYPAHLRQSTNDGLETLSTHAVGGDTPVTSMSASVAETDSSPDGNNSVHSDPMRSPLFTVEHKQALENYRGGYAAATAGTTAGAGVATAIADKEKDEKEENRKSHDASPGSPKSPSRFAGLRKLTKSRRRSRSGSNSDGVSPTRNTSVLSAGVAFSSSHPIDNSGGVHENMNKDPHLSPLTESGAGSGHFEPTPTPAVPGAASDYMKSHKLTKKHSPTGSPAASSTSTAQHTDAVASSANPHFDDHSPNSPETAADPGRFIMVNGSNTGTTKPKLMDRIRGEVKIMQGTIRGNEGKKLEGRMLKEFGAR